MRDELGLVSAYHHGLRGRRMARIAAVRRGDPRHPLPLDPRHPLFLFKESQPFHLDYCFLPETWLDRLASVEVGSFADWPQSDHRPLTVELTPGSPGDA